LSAGAGSGPHHGSSGLTNGGAHGPRPSLPTETFKQLRHAVLTSLDIADNVEHTVDYEDGGAELQEDIPLESQPSAKEVGKSVFEVRRPRAARIQWHDSRQHVHLAACAPPTADRPVCVGSGAAALAGRRVWLAGWA
jgi:hypothetical protein